MKYVKNYWGWIFVIPAIIFGFLIYAPILWGAVKWDLNQAGVLNAWICVIMDMGLLWYALYYVLHLIFKPKHIFVENIFKVIASFFLIVLIIEFTKPIGYTMIFVKKIADLLGS